MTYKYETHCHTNSGSYCSAISPQELVDLYVANGYSGIFISEHFFNCSSSVAYGRTDMTFDEKIDAIFSGYERAKEYAKGKIDVFFAFEYAYKGTDLLVYGWEKEELKTLREIEYYKTSDFIEWAQENGAFVVQAHPFREAYYIDHIRLFTATQGVETFNACRTESENKLARLYAQEKGKSFTGGSDLHHADQQVLSGMEFEEKITDVKQFISLVKEGKGKIIKQANALRK